MLSGQSIQELQAKLEKSESSRQKLRASLQLLKEKALNTGELVKQHQTLQGRLNEATQRAQQEQASREAAEQALDKLQREQHSMRQEVISLKTQMARAAKAADEAQAQAATACRAQQAQRAELDSLRRQVAALEEQVGSLAQQVRDAGAAPSPKRSRPSGADATAVQALAVDLQQLQAGYCAVQGEMQRWKAALGGLAVLVSGSTPSGPPPANPVGAEGSTMLAPLRTSAPAAIHESNLVEEEGGGEASGAAGTTRAAGGAGRL